MDLSSAIAAFGAWGIGLVHSWGYLGVFAVSIAGNASLFLPVPSYAFVIAAGAFLNPWLVGIAGGAGAAIGELVGYGVGLGGGRLAKGRHGRMLDKARRWTESHGMFAVLILFAATPLPDDIVGVVSGLIKYDIRKFFLATLIGKVISHVALAWAGALGSGFLGTSWLAIFIALGTLSFAAFAGIFSRKG